MSGVTQKKPKLKTKQNVNKQGFPTKNISCYYHKKILSTFSRGRPLFSCFQFESVEENLLIFPHTVLIVKDLRFLRFRESELKSSYVSRLTVSEKEKWFLPQGKKKKQKPNPESPHFSISLRRDRLGGGTGASVARQHWVCECDSLQQAIANP